MSSQKYFQNSPTPLQKQFSRKSRFMIRSLKMQIVPNQSSRLKVNELSPPGNHHVSDIISILKNCRVKDRIPRRASHKFKIKTEPSDYSFPLSMQSSLTCTKKVQEVRQKSLQKFPNINRRPTALQRFCNDTIKKRKSMQNMERKKLSIKVIPCSEKIIQLQRQNSHD